MLMEIYFCPDLIQKCLQYEYCPETYPCVPGVNVTALGLKIITINFSKGFTNQHLKSTEIILILHSDCAAKGLLAFSQNTSTSSATDELINFIINSNDAFIFVSSKVVSLRSALSPCSIKCNQSLL